MGAITTIEGRGVPLRGNDIDTDRIIPARFLRCVTFDGLGEHAFEDDRAQLRESGQTHPFDDERYAGARVLVANSNFGCGSSREHAPQAIAKWGIEAIVAVSYSEIFYGNNVAIGVPCLRVQPEEAAALQSAIEADPQLRIAIDIATASIRYGDITIQADLPEGVRNMFVTGQWDATGQLLANLDQVKQTAAALPYVSGYAD